MARVCVSCAKEIRSGKKVPYVLKEKKTMGYRVTWEPIWHQGLDFLMPGQGCGSRIFATKAAASVFVARLKHEGAKIDMGEHIFGSELKICVQQRRRREA